MNVKMCIGTHKKLKSFLDNIPIVCVNLWCGKGFKRWHLCVLPQQNVGKFVLEEFKLKNTRRKGSLTLQRKPMETRKRKCVSSMFRCRLSKSAMCEINDSVVSLTHVWAVREERTV